MNLFHLSTSDLMIWGLVLHLIADWPLQNDWMAANKARRSNAWTDNPKWWSRHPAAYVHAAIHGFCLLVVFGWVAIPLAISHLLIDTRTPVVWWSKLVGQSQPTGARMFDGSSEVVLVDVGLEVRFWTDQVFHIICIAIAAVLVSL